MAPTPAPTAPPPRRRNPDASRSQRLAHELARDCAPGLLHALLCLRHRAATSGRDRFRDASPVAHAQWPAVAAAADAIAFAAFADVGHDPANHSPIMRVTDRAERIAHRLLALDGATDAGEGTDLRRIVELGLFDAVVRVNNLRNAGRLAAPDPDWVDHAVRRLARLDHSLQQGPTP